MFKNYIYFNIDLLLVDSLQYNSDKLFITCVGNYTIYRLNVQFESGKHKRQQFLRYKY